MTTPTVPLNPGAGPALPVVVVTDPENQGGPAIPVYGWTGQPGDGRSVEGRPAVRVKVIADSDLRINGGNYWIEGRPFAMPVSGDTMVPSVSEGGVAMAVYPVNSWPTPPSVADPTFSPVAGVYVGTQSVTISTTTPGATIRYTTDGSTPSHSHGTVYSGAITISASETIKAIAYKSGDTDSNIVSAAYVVLVAPIIFDQFTAPNNTDLNGRAPSPTNIPGNAYVVNNGTAQIQGNQADCIALASGDLLLAIETGIHDLVATTKITPINIMVSGIVFRYQDSSHFVLAAIGCPSLLYILLMNGGYSIVAQASVSVPAGVQVLLGVTVSGNNITVSLNGINVIDQVVSNFNTATKVGWRNDQVGVLTDDLTITPTATFSIVDTTSPPTGQNIRVLVPSNYNADAGAPLIIYHHGVGETQTALTTDALKSDVVNTLLSNGYIIAGSNAHGDNWGNAASLTDYIELYNYCIAHYNITRVMAWAQSMGGQSGWLSLAQGTVPYKGLLGTFPVCNLADMFGGNVGTYAANIRAAYGIANDGSDYAAKTAGHDPILLAASSYNGKRTRFYASPGDTTVNKANNSDAMVALVTGHATEFGEVVCSGVHGDPSHFQPSDYLAFFGRCV